MGSVVVPVDVLIWGIRWEDVSCCNWRANNLPALSPSS